jgi:hypothetical protein
LDAEVAQVEEGAFGQYRKECEIVSLRLQKEPLLLAI